MSLIAIVSLLIVITLAVGVSVINSHFILINSQFVASGLKNDSQTKTKENSLGKAPKPGSSERQSALEALQKVEVTYSDEERQAAFEQVPADTNSDSLSEERQEVLRSLQVN